MCLLSDVPRQGHAGQKDLPSLRTIPFLYAICVVSTVFLKENCSLSCESYSFCRNRFTRSCFPSEAHCTSLVYCCAAVDSIRAWRSNRPRIGPRGMIAALCQFIVFDSFVALLLRVHSPSLPRADDLQITVLKKHTAEDNQTESSSV